MRPDTYARLYGPWRPQPPTPRPALTVVTVLLWTLLLNSLGLLLFYVGFFALWVWSEGATGSQPAEFVMLCAAGLLGGAALLTGLAFTPPLRQLSLLTRMFVLGLLALPVPVGVLMWAGVMAG
ncbi:hypothetical protein ACVNF4_07675 [Streptomyces sp. S6]